VEGESRPLHAKAIQWARGLEQRILLIGSSNASPSGLGLPGAPRNIEANLCFLARKDRRASRCFDACFPSAPAISGDRVSLEGSPIRADEEGGPPPVPAFFQWAAVDRSGATLELRLGLGGGSEPSWWHLSAGDGSFELDHERFARRGRPPVWEEPLPGDPSMSPPPSLIEIRWRSSDGEYRGSLPVNALNAGSRSRPDLWWDIDLETLLALLASSGPVYRRLARIVGRGNGKQGCDGVPVELDPHRRVDTSNFLMQRIRRVSLALEGLKERLCMPVYTEASLEWRFQGPLSPAFLARRLLDATEDSEERRFLVAEIALAVGNAARAVSSPALPVDKVQARYAAALQELESLIPPDDEDSLAGQYLVEVLKRVRG